MGDDGKRKKKRRVGAKALTLPGRDKMIKSPPINKQGGYGHNVKYK